MAEPVIIVPYDPLWKDQFITLGTSLRNALGDLAIRIDHIGSTSIEGLDAKPIIDIQVSVHSLEPINLYKNKLEEITYVYRSNNPDLTKRYFRESSGSKRTHIHVREHGSWSEQFSLLFRDYLRANDEDRNKYVEEKYKLMNLFQSERDLYVENKEPIIWEIMNRASKWSQKTGWRPGITDV